jgi:F420-non-reducing hydrogenase large subunit
MELRISEATRVAGHIGASITIGDGTVKARVIQNEFRGFEPLLKGRPLEEAPLYASRICGICQVSHALASVGAVEDGLDITVPWEVEGLREVANLAGTIQSHLLHLFMLIAPSSLGSGPPPTSPWPLTGGIVQSILDGRSLTQRMVKDICGRSIHPISIVPGGFSKGIGAEEISRIAALGDELVKTMNSLNERVLPIVDGEARERGVGLKARYMRASGGRIFVKDHDGSELLSFHKDHYMEHIEERDAEEGYGRRPYLRMIGYPDGFCRVGSLARLNYELDKGDGSPWPSMRHESVMYTYARMIESVRFSERIVELADELGNGVRASPAGLRFKGGEGTGVIEAPRGTLLHRYAFDDEGVITDADIITPTAFNASAIERDIEENISKICCRGIEELKERTLKVLRDYDPCIPCATHLVRIVIDRR